MELRFTPRRLLILLAAAGAALALALTLTTSLSGSVAQAATHHKKHPAHRVQTKHSQMVADTTQSGGQVDSQAGGPDTPGTPSESTSESTSPESATSETSAPGAGPGGPDAQGNNQCPPACGPGEQGQ